MKRILVLMLTNGLAFASFALAPVTGGGSSVGTGNPAAVFCDKAGGTPQYVSTARGQEGLCQFDRALIEQWTLRRSAGADRHSLAKQAFFSDPTPSADYDGTGTGIANPAAVNCQRVGGTLIMARMSGGGTLGLCTFSDRSQIEEWTLLQGARGNQRLAAILQAGVTDSKRATKLTEADSGREIPLRVDDQFVVQLAENASTGYSWHVVQADSGLRLIREWSVANQPILPGSGSTKYYRYEVVGEAEQVLSLKYSRGANAAAAQTFQVTIDASR